jgi:hypothetical protein
MPPPQHLPPSKSPPPSPMQRLQQCRRRFIHLCFVPTSTRSTLASARVARVLQYSIRIGAHVHKVKHQHQPTRRRLTPPHQFALFRDLALILLFFLTSSSVWFACGGCIKWLSSNSCQHCRRLLLSTNAHSPLARSCATRRTHLCNKAPAANPQNYNSCEL